MSWINANLIIGLIACGAAIWAIRKYEKENNPQHYVKKHILTIELWIILIFIINVMQKVTILIAW